MKTLRLSPILLCTLLLSLLLAAWIPTPALAGAAQQSTTPVVHAVLFFSPTCGHCEKLINEDLPPIQQQYGDQFQVLGIDVTSEGGQRLYQSTINAFSVPDDRLGVPTLVIGNRVLVGGAEIPQTLPGMIESALAADGIAWPAIPGLDQIIPEAANQSGQGPKGEAQDGPLPTWSIASMQAKFAKDPLANSVAVIVLLAMILSVVGVLWRFLSSSSHWLDRWPAWVIPVLAILGLGVSAYMSYIEVSQTQAICGPVGDCNAVQQSPYAKIFGVIPVGLFGLAGYVAILAAWLVQARATGKLQSLAAIGLWAMAFFGIIYSIYLTFLEPFVIGASCIWCLTQAIIMMLTFWASTGPAKAAWESSEDGLDEELDDELEPREA